MEKKKVGLYIHLPFCIRKCSYCDFLSFDVFRDADIDEYIQRVILELKEYKDYQIDTIFFGGGTPSLLSKEQISILMESVKANFIIDEKAEITIEANPNTLSKIKLSTYKEIGINRLSIGVQSLDNKILKVLGRLHTSNDFFNCFDLARDVGFENINVDLMFGIPTQTLDLWKGTLIKIIKKSPEHISFYGLKIEENTPIFEKVKRNILMEIDDGVYNKMYDLAWEMLNQNGYNVYEISNASKKGFECKHNLKYWSLDEYIGTGLGSHSFVDGYRWENITATGSSENKFSYKKANKTKADMESEYIFTGLRKTEGISFEIFKSKFGIEFKDIHKSTIDKLLKKRLIDVDEHCIKLTNEGIKISNQVFIEFI